MSDAELFVREAEFLERRRRVLRSMGALGAAAVAGIALPILAKLWAPQAFDAAVMIFVAGVAVAGLSHVRTLRRDWRCPACEARWDSNDVLASSHWNHCAACGAALRAAPQQRDRERLAVTEFELQHLPQEELEVRFRRRRRLGLLAFGGVVLLGAAAFALVRAQGWGEWAQNGVVALCAGLGVAAVALAARCPRCGVGLLGKGRHCQRCGFALQPGLP
jgi:peptidoglycan/LPS O-acetylase OafA/YrhL